MRHARRGYSSRNEREADMMAIPEEETIKPMTKGDDCTPVTMHDIFAHRKEALLTSKMMGKDKEQEFNSAFDDLLKDIKEPRDTYYRGKDIRNGWALTFERFMDLTAYYKAFFHGCTRDSMRLLLLQTRKEIVTQETNDPNRFKKSKYKHYHKHSNSDEPVQLFRCDEDSRLTPLDTNLYEHFFGLLSRKRLGAIANETLRVFLNPTNAYDNEFISPLVSSSGIKFMVNGNVVNLSTWLGIAGKRSLQTPSKLVTLKENEVLIAKGKNVIRKGVR